jgi:NodT family efflux transporter outer membrane factor (OMF) lipoprotein
MQAIVWAGLIACTGCTSWSEYIHNGFKVGPNYQRPPAPVSQNWINANDVRVRNASDDLSHWWTVFNDPILNGLVADAYRQNISLRQAAYRVLQARAVLGVSVGGLFPQTFQAIGDHTNNAISTQLANRSFVKTRFFGQYDSGFNMSWELDFWGRLRRAIIAANDNLDASVENYDDVLVTMLGDVAANYAQIRIFQAEIAYTRANVELQRSILTLVTARYRGGQVTALDVDQAQSILSQTESQIPALEISLRQANNALCVLLGISPQDLVARIGTGPIPTAPPEVAAGVPADLLRRRPDVRMAERLAAAQAEQIGIAEAEFYPHIYLNGTFEYSAQAYRNLFNQRAQQAIGGPSFQWNVLNFGRILNNVRAQDAEFQQLVAAYQFAVVTAAQETENGLITFLKSQEQTNELNDAVTAAQSAVNIAVVQYRGGMIDFNRVATLEQNLVQYQNLLAQARGSIVVGLVNTYRALGGGWDYRLDPASEGAPGLNAALNERGPAAEPVAAPNPFAQPEEPLPVPAEKKDDKPAEAPPDNTVRPKPKRALASLWPGLRQKPADLWPPATVPAPGAAKGGLADWQPAPPAYLPTVGEAKILRPGAADSQDLTPSPITPINWNDPRPNASTGAPAP